MECGCLPVVELLSRACEFCNPADVLPKLNVVTVNHSLGAFLRSFVIIAVEINRLYVVAISANQVSSIVRHSWTILHTGAPSSPSSQPRTLDSVRDDPASVFECSMRGSWHLAQRGQSA
jgi:hypothetical protein